MSKLKSNWHIIKWQEIVDSLASRLQIDTVLLLRIQQDRYDILSSNQKLKQDVISKSKNDILFPILKGKKEIYIADINKHPEQILKCKEIKNGNIGFFARAIFDQTNDLWGCIYCINSTPIHFSLENIDFIFQTTKIIESDLLNLSFISEDLNSSQLLKHTKNLLRQYELNKLKNKIQKLQKQNSKIHGYLKSNNDHLKKIEEIANLGHWCLDFNKRNSSWSDQVYHILNLEPQSVKANYKTFLNFIHPDDLEMVKQSFYSTLKDKAVYQIEHRLLLKDNSIKYIHIQGNIEFDDNNKPTHALGIIIDITKRKKTELLLQDAKIRAEESDQLKTDFLRNISHEIRTPLNGILGFIELLDKPNLSKVKQIEYSKIIRDSGNNLAKVITDILEMSNLENSNLTVTENTICLNHFLSVIIIGFSNKANKKNIPIHLNKTLNNKKSTIVSDKTRLSKIIHKLIDNALNFTPKGSIEIGYYLSDNKQDINIYVKDTGIGIKKENLSNIFQKFSKTKINSSKIPEGLGLGLPIAIENAKLLKGSIEITSVPEKGSIFTLSIPYKTPFQSKKEKLIPV